MRLPGRKHTEYYLIVLFFLTSCATISNERFQKVFISADTGIRVLSVDKAIATDTFLKNSSRSGVYYIPRSRDPVTVTLGIDSTIQSFILKPGNSPEYLLNILFNGGIGMLVDKDNAKRYGYPVRNHLTVASTAIKRRRFPVTERGTVNFAISLPLMINHFSIKTPQGQYLSGGVYGLKGGLEYFYKRNAYLSLNAGGATDVFGEYWIVDTGYAEFGNALLASLQNNHIAGSFDFGYGIHLSELKWEKVFGDSLKKDLSVKNWGIGPAVSTQFRIGKYFRVGAFYQPVLFDLKSMSLTDYQHYFSVDLFWKFPVRTPGRRIRH